jgi:hypothetical protein
VPAHTAPCKEIDVGQSAGYRAGTRHRPVGADPKHYWERGRFEFLLTLMFHWLNRLGHFGIGAACGDAGAAPPLRGTGRPTSYLVVIGSGLHYYIVGFEPQRAKAGL